MSSQLIGDGKGRGFKMSVSSSHRGNVSSKSNPRIYYVSREDGAAFSISSSYSATTGDKVIYFKNDNEEKNFVVTGFFVSADNSAKWTFHKVTGNAIGTDIEARVLNLTKNSTASATIKGDAAVTGITNEFSFAEFRTPANGSADIDFRESLIIGNGQSISVEYTGTTGGISVILGGYFEEHSTGVN